MNFREMTPQPISGPREVTSRDRTPVLNGRAAPRSGYCLACRCFKRHMPRPPCLLPCSISRYGLALVYPSDRPACFVAQPVRDAW